jgi:hypothetical protein
MTTLETAVPAPAQDHSTRTDRIRIEQHSGVGMLWLMGWLFSLGFLQLPFFWKGALALILWPYYLGAALTRLLP